VSLAELFAWQEWKSNIGKVMNMSKAKLIKKDSPLQEQLMQRRKVRRQRGKKEIQPRSAIVVTTEWLKSRSQETPSAREAFAALFSKPDPQSV
jgi:hypothetical protein